MDNHQAIEKFWTKQAASFDASPDHGLLDPQVREAWRTQLAEWMPTDPGPTADLGCGTGSLSLLVAKLGADVTGIDMSPAMIDIARAKAADADIDIDFAVGDAADPQLPAGSQAVVLSRHVVWTLPDPVAALSRWAGLLRDGGRMVLIEGVWFAPSNASVSAGYPWDGGVPATALIAELSRLFDHVEHYPLSQHDELWGKAVTDERYAVVATGPVGA